VISVGIGCPTRPDLLTGVRDAHVATVGWLGGIAGADVDVVGTRAVRTCGRRRIDGRAESGGPTGHTGAVGQMEGVDAARPIADHHRFTAAVKSGSRRRTLGDRLASVSQDLLPGKRDAGHPRSGGCTGPGWNGRSEYRCDSCGHGANQQGSRYLGRRAAPVPTRRCSGNPCPRILTHLRPSFRPMVIALESLPRPQQSAAGCVQSLVHRYYRTEPVETEWNSEPSRSSSIGRRYPEMMR
jgi:hypothetical protein